MHDDIKIKTLIRPISADDLSELINLAYEAGQGMTNLPKDVDALSQKIQTSLHSFKNGHVNSELLGYLFVLEDIATKKIVGCSGIAAAGSRMLPFYHFKMSNVNYVSQDLNLSSNHKILTMVNDYQGCSEICSLFLLPKFRKDNNGLLLSRARFLFMADHKERFSKTIIAEMRGVIHKDGSQPFWDNVISKFIDIPFLEADKLTGMGIKQFISDLMPRHPIYTDCLSKEAQEVIDCVHKDTEPALAILKQEGFRSQGYVDIFDAGPMVECELDNIKTIVNSKVKIIENILKQDNNKINNKNFDKEPQFYLISNMKVDIKICISNIQEGHEDHISIPEATANVLDIRKGDKVRIIELRE